MEIVIYKDDRYVNNETILLDKILSRKEIKELLDEKYGNDGWYSYDILV
jgi:hypothetical protein